MNNYGNQGYGQQGYGQDPYNQGYPQGQAPAGGGFKLTTDRELYCKCVGNGQLFAKKGSMVGYEGQFKFSKRLLGTNQGNIAGQVLNHALRKVTGENLEIMEVTGSGTVYLADRAQHVTILDLEPNGPWQSVSVESENLIAFTPSCHYGVTPIGVGVISQKGLFTSKLTYNGQGAQVAILTEGNPLVLQVKDKPICVDPDAMVCFTGPGPKIKTDVGLKTLIGQTSGESYTLQYTEPGQIIVIQPYERESGISVRDTNRPEMQSGPSFGAGGNGPAYDPGNIGGMDVGNIAGNVLGGLFNR